MRNRLLVLALLVPLALQSSKPQNTGSTPDISKFVGVWRGQFDNLPGVDLVIDNEGGSLHGAVIFYLHKRPDINSPYTATPGLPGPLLNMRAEGQILHFQLSHRLAHPPRTLNDPLINFQLRITGPDDGELVNRNEGGPGLPMKRTDF